MNEWRSEPPDSAGWWLWRAVDKDRSAVDDRPYVACARFSESGYLKVYTPYFPVECGAYAPMFGQWLKVPE